MRKLIISIALLGLGCDGAVTVDDVDCAYPEPPPVVACGASTPPLIEVDGARAVYAWAYGGGPQAPWTFSAFTSPSWGVAESGGAIDVPDLLAGDSILVFGQMFAETAGGEVGLRLAVAENRQQPIEVPGAKIALKPTSPKWSAVSLIGIWNVIVPGQARVILEGRADPGGRVYVQGSVEIVAIHLRP